MRLIDADKLMPINAPIAGITTGVLTHYEKIVFWKVICDAPTINVIDQVLEIIDKADEEYELWALKFQKVRDAVLALKGEQE